MTDAPHTIGMMPSHPGAILREEILAPLKLNVTKAAKALGVRRATLSDLLNEKAALSPEMREGSTLKVDPSDTRNRADHGCDRANAPFHVRA
jgi:hypothetical protein